MPEIPEERAPKKAPCRWRLNPRFMYECTYCHSLNEKAPCPHKESLKDDGDDGYDGAYYMGGGL